MDLRRFNDRMRRRAENLLRNTERTVKRAALGIDTALVMSTPVDTGRARANWQVSLNRIPSTEVPGGTSPQQALNQGTQVIGAYSLVNNDVIYIVNNVPYIRKLNNGWSAQAPAGFVEDAVNIGNSIIQSARRIL